MLAWQRAGVEGGVGLKWSLKHLWDFQAHALLLTTSITMMTLKFTEFRYREFWKVGLAFALVMVYALVEIYILKVHHDPMYFMPDGDIQAGILRISYGLYLAGYILLVLTYINVPYLIADKKTVKAFFGKLKGVKK